jgi:uridine kinase
MKSCPVTLHIAMFCFWILFLQQVEDKLNGSEMHNVSGNSAVQAIELLIQKGVPESHIIFLNLISAPEGIHMVCKRFPLLKIVTSEIDAGLNDEYRVVPGMGEFGDRYFGTDDDGPDQLFKTPIDNWKVSQVYYRPLKPLGNN